MTNGMSYVLYQIELLPMTLIDVEGHLSYFKDFYSQCNVKIVYVCCLVLTFE